MQTESDKAFDALESANPNSAKDPMLVKVKYVYAGGKMSDREYTYFTAEPLALGDHVVVPIRETTGEAEVTAINVALEEIAAFFDKVKRIPPGSVMVRRAPDIGPADMLTESPPCQPFATEKIVASGTGGGIPRTMSGTDDLKFFVITEGGAGGAGGTGSPAGPKVQGEPNETDLPPHVEVLTAVVKIAPGKDPRVQALLTEVLKLQEWARVIVVASEEDVKKATADLNIMATLSKTVESHRQEYVGPLNAHVTAVNSAFKLLSEPLGVAIKTAKEKVTAFKLAQAERQREAIALNQEAEELARKQAAANQGAFTVDTTPVVVPPAPKLTRTEMGSAGLVDNWGYEVTDFKLLPDEYKVADAAMLNMIAKKYHGDKLIPGVSFVNKPTLRVSSR